MRPPLKHVGASILSAEEKDAFRDAHLLNVGWREIYYALERQSGFGPGLRFVIPVLLESHPQLPLAELSQLHVIDLTAPAGIDDLAQAILDDWQTRQILRGI